MPSRDRISCGLLLHNVTDIYDSVTHSQQLGYTFIIAPLVHPRFRREFLEGKAKDRPGAFTRSDLLLSTQDWSTTVVGRISSWINPDSPVPTTRRISELALEQELQFAAHLNIPAVFVKPRNENCFNLARYIYTKILGNSGHPPNFGVWVHIPMRCNEEDAQMFRNTADGDVPKIEADEPYKKNAIDTWEWWNAFRTACNTDKKVGLALEMSADLPSYYEIQRWLGEPIRCVILSTSLFSTNKKGFPVLAKTHQNLLKKMFKLDVQVVLSGCNKHNNYRTYYQYLEHLWAKFMKNKLSDWLAQVENGKENTQEPDDALSTFAKGYEDYLQFPLQPLMDNLESSTYEIFEKDPTKYAEYQRAIHAALLDRVSDEEKDSKIVVVMVVGAGRGPLVRASISAAKNADRLIKVYAVEKNPNAIVTLHAQQYEMWGDQVTVVSSDMRDWNAPEKADILVSELLGSFGDNELSPECLDGAQKFLKDDGISIPCSYTNYVVPVSAPKLYSEIAQMREKDKHPLTFFEMPYVVHLHNHTLLSSPKPLFTFVHPNREVQDNSRYEKLTFSIPYNCTIHGFAGYFDTVLYKDVSLSIHPTSHSPGLFSWFPIFFPIKDPIYVSSKDQLDVHFWRCVSPRKVWYEWLVTKPVIGSLHNPCGRSYTIGL